MKYVVYTVLAIIAFFLFMPTTDGKEIRNLPLLIAILVIIAGFLLWHLRLSAFSTPKRML